jgi:hypothetical protein
VHSPDMICLQTERWVNSLSPDYTILIGTINLSP